MSNDRLKFALVAVIAGLVGIIFVGIFVLIALGRDVEQVTTFALIVIPVVITAAGLGGLQVQQAQKLDTIAKNVNGNMTKLVNYTTAQKLATGSTPIVNGYGNELAENDVSEETLQRIKTDVDQLPKHSL